jgi:coproporphyrinogen III oxidase-like Fe-S oxidoreductase
MNSVPSFDDFFCDVPSSIDVEAIRNEWQALAPDYNVNDWRLPLPPWTQRPYDDSGSQAWDVVRQNLTDDRDLTKPFCIYLHIPFCSSKCGFCDNYSFKLGTHQDAHIQDYVDRLCYELRLWSEQGNLRYRPVSTVHMGGGTPTFIGEAALTQIVECCRACFAISPSTEWALESTVQSLTPSMIATMHDLGYRRLHVGVQSLQPRTRAEIGRRSSPAQVLEKIAATRALDWVVSVDMICGLPYQTLSGLIDDLEQLMAVGTNGISLYELLIYPQNRKWAQKQGLIERSHLPNYWMYLAGANFLESKNYCHNLFNHWADEHDDNIYFTFPMRGEDLLAVGSIADGMFGDYHYRHPRYAPYMQAAHSGLPGLEGGLRRTALEETFRPLTTRLLSGHIPTEMLLLLREVSDTVLPEQWLAHKLVKANLQGGYNLSTSGSWFVGNMIAEVFSQVAVQSTVTRIR